VGQRQINRTGTHGIAAYGEVVGRGRATWGGRIYGSAELTSGHDREGSARTAGVYT